MTPQEIVNKIDSSEIPYEVYHKINEYLDNDKEEDALFYLQNYFKCSDNIAKETLILYKETVYAGHSEVMEKTRTSLTPEQIARANAVARECQNKPKCPTCQSTNIKKVSGTSKAISVAMFGLLSQKVKNNFIATIVVMNGNFRFIDRLIFK